jgi:hypothetical protein
MTNDVLRAVGDGVWIARDPVRIVGMPLASSMTVLRLRDDELLVHSPVSLTPERRVAVEALGRVAHLYAPNTFHHRWIGDWAKAFPDARLHAPKALAQERPDLRVHRAHDVEREPAFDGILDEHHIAGFRLEESVLYHRATKALVVADLVHNIGRPPALWTKIYAGMMGFYDRVALSRIIRWTAFSDKRAARRCIDSILEHAIGTVLVGHGDPVEKDARDRLADAYAWMPRATELAAAPERRLLRGTPCG